VPVDAPLYPVNLIVEGRRCLVVGGGKVAARKVAGLRACGADVHVVAPEVSDEIRAEAGVTFEERPYRRGEVAGYRLVISATDDRAVSEAVSSDAEEAGVWVNAADDPALCSFTLPSVVRRGPLLVTVATGGHSPALATWLRARLEKELGPEYEVLLQLLSEARDRLRAGGSSTEDFDWQTALDSDMLELIRAGQVQQARERLEACLSSSSA
jgi:precorrin-2 dehydrogenase / sirohydrochlorin ferrochelatase